MKAFTVREAVAAVGGRYFGTEAALDHKVLKVSTDSRAIAQGTLFAAFKGARADGHDFMADCLVRGATCCISEREPKDASETPCIVVRSSLEAMGALAAWYRSRFEIPVVGITGSVGKTTTKEMIWAVLGRKFRTHKTQKNFNNELGCPQTLLNMPEDAQAAVIEMGISDFGEMSRLTRMVRPKIAVISIIGHSHLEFLGDREGVLRAKAEIFEGMQAEDLAIFNGDDDLLKAYIPNTRRITYGRGADNDFVAEEVENLGDAGMRMKICHHGQRFEVRIPAFGAHMVYAALAGAACGWALGLSDDEIAAGIAEYETVGDRAKLIDTGRITIISDCYNANPNSTASALESLSTLQGRKVCILGDMLELGENSARLHFETGAKAAECGTELIISCGKLAKDIHEGAVSAGGNAMYFAEKAELIAKLDEYIQDGDSVLVKASHSMAFEEIVEALK